TNGTAPYTVAALTPLPPGFVLESPGNASVGGPGPGQFQVRGVPLLPGAFTFTLRADDAVGNVGVRTFTLRVSATTVASNFTLPTASTGQFYSQPIIAFDNTGAPVWSLAAGSATPPGLSLSSAGLLSGTPSQAGVYTMSIIATD